MDVSKNRKKLIFSLLSLLTACALLPLIIISLLPSGGENRTSDFNLNASPITQVGADKTGETATYLVTKVIDGDTFKLLINDREETVRLLGIDTPETKAPKTPVECFGREASDKLASFLNNKSVVIEFDPTQGESDRYGRLLLYIWVDGLFVNREMIRQGYAYEYTYNLPYKYQPEFRADEKYARENKLGLWGAVCASVTPAVEN